MDKETKTGSRSITWPRAIKRYRRWWHVTQRAYRLYIIGQITFFVGMVVQASTKGAAWPMAILVIGAMLFFFGFVSWSHPVVKKAISSEPGKWAYRIAHGFVAIFAIVVARAVVCEALKLPPQYFDVTVGLVALITYIPVWLAAVALLLAILFAVMYTSWGIGQFFQTLCSHLIIPFVGRPKWFVRTQLKMEIRWNKLYLHAVGIVTALFFFAMLLDGIGYVAKYSMPGIRWFAYFADFQPAGNYPGATCEGRIRLLDNGIVAVANIVDYDITISRGNFKPDSNTTWGCIASGNSQETPK